MKKIALLCLLLPAQAFAAITLVQHTAGTYQSGGTSTTGSLTGVANGDMILVAVRFGTTGATFTVSDSVNAGNYSEDKVQTLATDGDTVAIFSKVNTCAGTCNITITASSSASTSIAMAEVEVSGLASSSYLDQTASANASSTSPNSGNAATTTTANEFVFSALGLDGANSVTITGAGSTTLLDTATNTSSGNKVYADGYQIVSATGAYAGAYSLTVSEEWAALVATYKGAGGVSSCTHEGYTSGGALAVPNGTSGTYLGKTGGFVTPDCSTVNYWQPTLGNFGVN